MVNTIMGRLTETEIFDCLVTNFRLAAENASKLATSPRKGLIYDDLRKQLALVEGACRQAGAWREDSRWFPIGLLMEEAHKKAGDWIRGIKMPDGSRVKFPNRTLYELFTKLSENLRALHTMAAQLRDAKTGRLGMILPEVQPGPHRDTRPVGWNQAITKGGIILPPGAWLH